MQTNYSEQDSERVRQTEQTSAGLHSQHLTNPHRFSPTHDTPTISVAPAASERNNNPVALALIAIGICMLIARFIPDPGEVMGGMVLFTIASCFLFFSLWKHLYGLLIPGCILGGLSAGVAFADVTNGASVMWGLALGFLSIFLLGHSLFQQRSQWPIYPAVILFTIGIIVTVASAPVLFAGIFIWLPLLLIGAGFYFGWHRPRIG